MAKKLAKPETARTVRLRIHCINPPDASIEFGLQNQAENLVYGTAQADGSLRFECALRIKRAADGKPNFLGEFAHGTPTDRFLYLTRKRSGQIISRIKVKLAAITWEQVEAAEQDGWLEASLDGQGVASVKLLGAGWQIVH